MRVRLTRFVFFLSLLIMIAVSGEAVPAGDIQVTEMAVTTKIVKGNPIDSVRRISSSSVKALFCFTRLSKDMEEESTVKHVWYKNDQIQAEYDLPVQGTRWRTYSRKLIGKSAIGDWRVEVQDTDGTVLKSVTFRIN